MEKVKLGVIISEPFLKLKDDKASKFAEDPELTIKPNFFPKSFEIVKEGAEKSGDNISKWCLENNVLIIKFDKYGITEQKEFYSKEDMKKIKYSEMKTNNPVSKQSFVTSFLQSIKQKM